MAFHPWRDRLVPLKRRARLRAESQVRLRERFDPFLLGIAATLAAIAMLVGGGLAYLHNAFGIFDRPPMSPLADERLLENIRSTASRAGGAFVGAVYGGPGNDLLVLRGGGVLHQFDPLTGLWTDSTALVGRPGIVGPYADLSLACPREAMAKDACAGPESVFAYAAGGGIAWRDGGDWRTLIAETRFVGLSGKPVTDDSLSSAAVSPDRRWLVVATQADGLGLFDLRQRRWIPIDRATQVSVLGSGLAEPTVIAAYGEEFLLGTENGLAVFAVDASGMVQAPRRVAKPDRVVLDISVQDSETLVLARTSCPGGTCIGLYRYSGDGIITDVMAESELFAELASATVSRALLSHDGTAFYVLGDAGVYRYVRATRKWSQLSKLPASAFLEAPSIEGIYFATPGKVNFLSSRGVIDSWDVDNERVISIAQASGGGVLVQTSNNRTYAVDSSARLLTAGVAATESLAAMKRGVSAFGHLVALGEKSILLHDPKARSYHSVPRASIDGASLRDGTPRLVGTPGVLWALTRGRVEAYLLEDAETTPKLALVGDLTIPDQLRAVHADGDGLVLVTEDGTPFDLSVRAGGISLSPRIGSAMSGDGVVVDAILDGDQVLLARADAVDVYSLAARGALPAIPMPIDETIHSIAVVSGKLYLLGQGGSIVSPGQQTPLTGSAVPLPDGSDALSDALFEGASLYLASPGDVAVYDVQSRRVTRDYRTPSGMGHRLAGLIDTVPVSYDGDGAWLGEASLAVGPALVSSASVAGSVIVTTQRSGGRTFMARYQASSAGAGDPVCYFGNPGPADADIIDVAQLPDGRSVALAGSTLWLRDETHRRYVGFVISGGDVLPSTRLHIVGDHITAATETAAIAVPISRLSFPDSCSFAPVDLTKQAISLSALQLAVSSVSGTIWLLSESGEFGRWQGGSTTQILPPVAEPAPTTGAFQSADIFGRTLLFSDAANLWRYDLVKRTWARSAITAGESPLVRTDIWQSGDDLLVTAVDERGRTWGGRTATSGIALDPLVQRRFPALPFDPGQLRDVAALPNGIWAFLGRDQLALAVNPELSSAQFEPLIRFSSAQDDRSLWTQSGNLVVLDGDPNRPRAVHVTSMVPVPAVDDATDQSLRNETTFVPQPGETFHVLRAGSVLRGLLDGSVLLCPPGVGLSADTVCEDIVGPALSLSPGGIDQVFAFDREALLLRDPAGHLTLLDRHARQLVDVAGNVSRVAGAIDAREGDVPLILDQDRTLFALDRDAATLTPQAADVRLFRRQDTVDLIQGADTAVGRRDGAMLDPDQLFAELGGKTDGNLRDLDLTQRGAAGRIVADGYDNLVIVEAGQAQRIDDILSLPGAGSVPVDTSQVFPLRDGQWLLLSAAQLTHIGRASCSVVPPSVEPAAAQEDLSATSEESADAAEVAPASTEPPPAPVTCLAILGTYRLPDDLQERRPHIQEKRGNDEIVLDGALWRLSSCADVDVEYADPTLIGRPRARDCQLQPAADSGVVAVVDAPQLRDARSELLGRIDTATGHLDATRIEPSGEQLVVMTGEIDRGRWPGDARRALTAALATETLGWDRNQRAFQFRDASGRSFLVDATDAMPDGRFAFTAPGTPVMVGPRTYVVANRYGVWGYTLGNPLSRSWNRVALPDASVAAGRGRVFFAGQLSIGASDAAPTSLSSVHDFNAGRLSVRADILAQSVAAAWSDGAASHAAFSGDGFVFDRRLDVAAMDNDGWLLTPVGLIHAVDFGRSAPSPDRDNITSWNASMLANSGQDDWIGFDQGVWRYAADPSLDRVAAIEGEVEWRFTGGQLSTVGRNGRSDLSQRSGLRFESDVLHFAAIDDDGLAVALSDGTRQLADFSTLATLPVGALPTPSDTAKLEARRLPNGKNELVAIGAGGEVVSLWTDTGFRALSDAENPDIQRTAAAADWLRVRFAMRRPIVELALEDLSGNVDWSSVAWDTGAPMPFDRFTDIAGNGAVLVAGSSVALQLLTPGDSGIVSQRFLDMRNDRGPYDPVKRIGMPMGRGGVIVAHGSRTCVGLSGPTITRCNHLASLAIEDLGGDTFWQWQRTSEGISMFYWDATGVPLSNALAPPQRGRFAHDIVDDMIDCRGRHVQSWGGNLTELSGSSLAGSKTMPVEQGKAVRLLCRDRSTVRSQQEPNGLPAGLYALGDQAWNWSPGTAAAVPQLGPALRARAQGLVPFEAAKIRAVNAANDGRLSFEYLRAGSWEKLTDQGGRLDIDQRSAVVFAESATWAYTPAGFVMLNGRDGGLDVDKVTIAPVLGDGRSCLFDVVETADGKSSYLPKLPAGAATVLRCLDGRLLTGLLNAPAEGRLFTELGGPDPFERRVIVDEDVLRIERVARVAGRPGSLSFGWRGEDNALVAGRFAFDDLSGMARLQPDVVDLVTAAGWVRQDRFDLSAAGARRPTNRSRDAMDVIDLALDINVDRLDPLADELASLCVTNSSGMTARWFATGRFSPGETCHQLVAYDGSYAYRLSPETLVITGASRNGATLTRRLRDGRFSDHVITGHVVIGRLDGEPVLAMGAGDQISLFDPISGAQMQGWSWSAPVDGVTLDEGGEIVVMAGGGLHTLSGGAIGSCAAFSDFDKAMDSRGLSYVGLHFRGGRVFTRVNGQGQAVEASFECGTPFRIGIEDLAGLDDRPRYATNRDAWGRPLPALVLFADSGQIKARMSNGEATLFTDAALPLFQRRVGDRMVFLTHDEIYAGDLDAIASAVQRAVRR